MQMNAHKIGCLFGLVMLMLAFVLFLLTRLSVNPLTIVATHHFKIDRAFIIAMDPAQGERLADEIRQHLHISDVTIKEPVNGTSAVEQMSSDPSLLSLYSRHILRTGRNDHMHIGNPGMLSCLLSHLEIWEKDMRVGETVAVFEEDAQLDDASAARLAQLSFDLKGEEWDVLLLERGYV